LSNYAGIYVYCVTNFGMVIIIWAPYKIEFIYSYSILFPITHISVKCSDSGEYKCSISGNTVSINIDSESAPKTVGMRGKKKLLQKVHL
jgi:hypothetical protein